MKTAYIGMSADPPHFGHVRLLMRVKDLGFKPIAIINSDNFIRTYKKRKPSTSEEKRVTYFETRGYDVEIVDKEKQQELIKKINPDVIVVGTDWMKPEILPQLGIDEQFLTDNDIGMLFLPRTPGISSTMLREKNEQ